MADHETATELTVYINVQDDPKLSCCVAVPSMEIVNNPDKSTSADCELVLTSQAYHNLLNGLSTFDNEVLASNLKIKGNYKLLREFGSDLRANS